MWSPVVGLGLGPWTRRTAWIGSLLPSSTRLLGSKLRFSMTHDIFESLWYVLYAKESFYKQYTASLILTWFGYIWTLNDLQNFVQFVDVPWITDFKKEESAVFQKWIRAKTFRSVFFHCIFCSKSQGTKNRKFKRYQKIHVKNRKVTELKNFTDVFGWYTWFG